MPRYQLLSCRIALAGDVGNVVVRSAFDAITYPEYIVLSVLHGESAISSILDVGETEERDRNEEFNRLGHIYREEIIKMLFPGHAINLPERNDRYPKDRTHVSPDTAPIPIPDQDIDPQIAQSVATQLSKRVSGSLSKA